MWKIEIACLFCDLQGRSSSCTKARNTTNFLKTGKEKGLDRKKRKKGKSRKGGGKRREMEEGNSKYL